MNKRIKCKCGNRLFKMVDVGPQIIVYCKKCDFVFLKIIKEQIKDDGKEETMKEVEKDA